MVDEAAGWSQWTIWIATNSECPHMYDVNSWPLEILWPARSLMTTDRDTRHLQVTRMAHMWLQDVYLQNDPRVTHMRPLFKGFEVLATVPKQQFLSNPIFESIVNILKTIPIPNRNGSCGTKSVFVCHKSLWKQIKGEGHRIFTPCNPSFYGIFWGHVFLLGCRTCFQILRHRNSFWALCFRGWRQASKITAFRACLLFHIVWPHPCAPPLISVSVLEAISKRIELRLRSLGSLQAFLDVERPIQLQQRRCGNRRHACSVPCLAILEPREHLQGCWGHEAIVKSTENVSHSAWKSARAHSVGRQPSNARTSWKIHRKPWKIVTSAEIDLSVRIFAVSVSWSLEKISARFSNKDSAQENRPSPEHISSKICLTCCSSKWKQSPDLMISKGGQFLCWVRAASGPFCGEHFIST